MARGLVNPVSNIPQTIPGINFTDNSLARDALTQSIAKLSKARNTSADLLKSLFNASNVKWNTVTIDLSSARDDEEFNISGTFLFASDATDAQSEVKVKFNSKESGEVNFINGRVISRARYERLFLTNAAQSGKEITLVYGTETNPVEIEG